VDRALFMMYSACGCCCVCSYPLSCCFPSKWPQTSCITPETALQQPMNPIKLAVALSVAQRLPRQGDPEPDRLPPALHFWILICPLSCSQSRNAFPAKEILNLTDYRQRYNQYSTRLPHTLHCAAAQWPPGDLCIMYAGPAHRAINKYVPHIA
jgi:hypothetical protein